MKTLISLMFGLSFVGTAYITTPNEPNEPVKEEVVEVFSPEALQNCIDSLGLKFPEIVMAQARLETGHFKSFIFRENNNLFGMRYPRKRPSANIGKKHGYSLYKDWKQSVLDYSLYQSTYLSHIKTQEEYLSYLKKHYAQDPKYLDKVKSLIKMYKIEG